MARKLDEYVGMPQLHDALFGWQSRVTLNQITTTIDAFGRPAQKKSAITFQGVIQPLSAEELMLKPEAQRGYEWLQIHVPRGVKEPLTVGDLIEVDSVEYRVNALLNYKRNGYIEYHCVRRLDVD